MNKYIVGGTFDSDGGQPSSVVHVMAKNLQNYKVINGGYIDDLYRFRPHGIDILIWMPNVDNSEDKILPRLKVMNPKMMLISSKRIDRRNYTDFNVIVGAIKSKSNLCIRIDKSDNRFSFDILDPLGNSFGSTDNIDVMVNILNRRIDELKKVSRMSTQQAEFDPFPDSNSVSYGFLSTVQHFGQRFAEIIKAENPDRFLGNASTRCEFGFPSEKRDDHILISKRNINKETICSDDFVKTYSTKNGIFYVGKCKPSVDAPIQLKLYDYYKKINYIIHGHCYIEGANYTRIKLPCGDLREFNEIKKLHRSDVDFATTNIFGHGCLIMCNDLKDFYNIQLTPRPIPEG